jgi:Ca-activated chloride channel homolog
MTVKRFRLASLSSFLFFLITFNITSHAQRSPDPSLQNSAGSNARPVIFPVVVADKKGHYIDGLGKSNFTVYDNKAPREIILFSANDEPASIGIILDLSTSLTESGQEDLKTALTALGSLIKSGHPDNQYFVIGFSERMQLFADWSSADKAIAALSASNLSVKLGHNTALFDACYSGVEKMRAASHSRQILLLISDGLDNLSKHTFRETREALKASNVLLYSIGIISRDESSSSLGMEGRAILNELSTVTGGAAFHPEDKRQINGTFDHLAVELREQYWLGFAPSGGADGRWHQLKIKITTPQKMDLSVRSKGGYYPPRN